MQYANPPPSGTSLGINDAASWWRVYIRNLAQFAWIAAAVELPVLTLRIWEALESLDSQLARATLGGLWAAAPDNKIIHKWPGWDALCDLCSEDWALEIEPLTAHHERVPLNAAQELRASDLAWLLKPGDLIAGGRCRRRSRCC